MNFFQYYRYIDLWEFGLVVHWMQEAIPKAEECLTTKTKDKSIRLVPIHLYDLASAFLILGIGLGLATLYLLIELIQVRLKRHLLYKFILHYYYSVHINLNRIKY